MVTALTTVQAGSELAHQRGTSFSVQDVLDRLELIQDLMRRAMVKDIDYGQIPGTNSKPTLLKPGAEKLSVMFRMKQKYITTKTFHDDGHLTVDSTCQIFDAQNNFLGEAEAICSTRESKYAYRNAARLCPHCGKAAIIKGKEEYGGGWVCFKKKDGCGAKFADTDATITQQQVGRVANPDLADTYNTVLRIAAKRSFIAAIRPVTGSSALFDEEIPGVNELDDPGHYEHPDPEKPREAEKPRIEDIPGLKRGSDISQPAEKAFVSSDQLDVLQRLFREHVADIDNLLHGRYKIDTDGMDYEAKLHELYKVPAKDFAGIKKTLLNSPKRKPEAVAAE